MGVYKQVPDLTRNMRPVWEHTQNTGKFLFYSGIKAMLCQKCSLKVQFFTKDMTVIYEHTRYRMPLIIRVNFSSYNESNSQKTRTKHMQINRILYIFVVKLQSKSLD